MYVGQQFASFANEIQATVLSIKDGLAEMQIYASVARINFKFAFDIIALDSKGKEVGRIVGSQTSEVIEEKIKKFL